MCEEARFPVSKVTGVTRINAFKLSYEWKIYNFEISGLEQSQSLDSEKFGPVENDNIRWSLQLYPKGDRLGDKDYISLFLSFHCDSPDDSSEAKYDFGIYDKQGQIQHKISHPLTRFNVGNHSWGVRNYIKRTDLLTDDLYPNQCLTLVCNIVGSMGKCITLPNSYDNLKKIESYTHSKLQSGYEELFRSEKLFDITFRVSEKILYAHKAILAAHSPVFLAMFENDMREKNCSQVDVTDIQSEAFEEMLKFIYCGKIEPTSSLVSDLLYVADKYAIQALKDECEKQLILKLSVENVIDTLIVADTYNTLNLRQNAIYFIVMHKDELVRKDAFKSIKHLQPGTWEEITRGLILH